MYQGFDFPDPNNLRLAYRNYFSGCCQRGIPDWLKDDELFLIKLREMSHAIYGTKHGARWRNVNSFSRGCLQVINSMYAVTHAVGGFDCKQSEKWFFAAVMTVIFFASALAVPKIMTTCNREISQFSGVKYKVPKYENLKWPNTFIQLFISFMAYTAFLHSATNLIYPDGRGWDCVRDNLAGEKPFASSDTGLNSALWCMFGAMLITIFCNGPQILSLMADRLSWYGDRFSAFLYATTRLITSLIPNIRRIQHDKTRHQPISPDDIVQLVSASVDWVLRIINRTGYNQATRQYLLNEFPSLKNKPQQRAQEFEDRIFQSSCCNTRLNRPTHYHARLKTLGITIATLMGFYFSFRNIQYMLQALVKVIAEEHIFIQWICIFVSLLLVSLSLSTVFYRSLRSTFGVHPDSMPIMNSSLDGNIQKEVK